MSVKVLHLGWEFPPFSLGGLGVACEGLIRALTEQDIEVLLVLPRSQESTINKCHIIATDDGPLLRKLSIDVLLQPYMTSYTYQEEYVKQIKQAGSPSLYGENIFAEVERYARVVSSLVDTQDFDIIHAHDWMSFKAGVLAKIVSGKPLVVHVHATEFDRTGGNGVNQLVYDIERWGMHAADKVIAVSQFTKNKIVEHYGIEPHKVMVIHNAIAHHDASDHDHGPLEQSGPMVLFLGRLTLQKGPDYFITAAQELLKHRPDVRFVVAGSGDMEHTLIDRVAQAGISDKVLFSGQLSGADVDRAYRRADVFVMPSVSEPFGLTALEAMKHGTPVILSKQSGVSEVVGHALKVDFWDINEIVNKVIGVLDHGVLKQELIDNAQREIQKFSWHESAAKCIDVYNDCLARNTA